MFRKKIYKILSGLIVFLNIPSVVFANTNYNSIEDFVSKTYEVFLDRDVNDDVGIDYWSYLVRNHEKSLYDYMTSFISGEEFNSREVSDEEFLSMIYKILFNRDINEDEKIYWIEKLSSETTKTGNSKDARLKIAKIIFGEPGLREISKDLGVTFDFKNLNNFGVDELKKDYESSKIEYVNSFYKGISQLGKELSDGANSIESRSQALEHIYESLPIFSDESNKNKYEELISVSDGNVERIVHSLDYDIKFPYGVDKTLYMSAFLQLNEGENLDFVTLGFGVTSKGFEKEISKAEIILGDEILELKLKYKDHSRYESNKISLHEFEFDIKSIEDLILLDKMLSSDLSKLRFTFGDSNVYIYNLYEKDRIRNTLRFMWSVYSQIVVSYLFESKDMFDNIVLDNLEQ